MCLQKILHVISSLPPPQTLTQESSFNPRFGNLESETKYNEALLCRNEGFDIDLNLELVSDPEAERNSLVMDSAIMSMSEKSDLKGRFSSGNKNVEESDSVLVAEDTARELSGDKNSEIDTNVGIYERNKIETLEPERKEHPPESIGGEDCLAMLIEAAKLIAESGTDNPSQTHVLSQHESPESKPAETRQSNRSHCWTSEAYNGIAPVVRSKWGRSQVLPCRFRDSVLEPLSRLSTKRKSR